jgi:hypothetical protein
MDLVAVATAFVAPAIVFFGAMGVIATVIVGLAEVDAADGRVVTPPSGAPRP